jgi:capsular polysaccharide biosynthesis protein
MKNTLGKIIHQKRLLLKECSRMLRQTRMLSPLRLDHVVEAEKEVGRSVQNFQLLWPAQKVSLEPTENERKFLKISKYFNDGFYSRENIFVCEVPRAYCHIGTGLVCTPDFKVIAESQMEYRLPYNRNYRWFKPVRIRRLAGTRYATINNIFSHQWQHWTVDCLTRLYSLSQAYPGQRIVLLTPTGLRRDWNESLAAALPPNFEIKHLPRNTWVQVDCLILPSYVSARANHHLPPGYYETMRKTTFERLELPPTTEQSERIYVSRSLAAWRRILNEDDLVRLLGRYGFKSMLLEKTPFREQVDLFRRAEIIAGAYGSNWGNNIYSGKTKNFVLYAERPTEPHVFTLTKGLGQEHFFLAGTATDVNTDITANLADVERVLQDEMNLRPVVSA